MRSFAKTYFLTLKPQIFKKNMEKDLQNNRIRLAMLNKKNGETSFGNWLEDTPENANNLKAWVISMNKEWGRDGLYHYIDSEIKLIETEEEF